ncbi:MAG: hypothetical protein U0270_03855 [Labilithrix sp.]
MNRISILKFAARPALTLLLVVGLSIAGTACADDDDQTNEPSSQTSEITEIDKHAAETQPNPIPVTTTDVTEHASLVKSCETCGPLPDPWTKGPLPDPWAQSSSSGTSTPGTSTGSGHK